MSLCHNSLSFLKFSKYLESALGIGTLSENTAEAKRRSSLRTMVNKSEEKPERGMQEFNRNSGHMSYTCEVNLPHLKKIMIVFFLIGKTQKTIPQTDMDILESNKVFQWSHSFHGPLSLSHSCRGEQLW